MNTPKVSIILVNYNGAADTLECIGSLTKVRYENREVIVVDNASTDGSVTALKAASGIVLLEAPENLGFSGGNNMGIRYALDHGADYVLLLNNDTLVTEGFLEPLVAAAGDLGPKSVLTSKILYAGQRDTLWYAGGEFNRKLCRVSHTRINEKDSLQEKRREVTFISGCCMLLHRSVIESLGELDEKFFLYCEDLEYCCRLRQGGCTLWYEPESVIFHKVSASTGRSSTLSVYYTVRNKGYIIDEYIERKYRWLARTYVTLENAKRVAAGEYPAKAVARGNADHRRKVTGKVTL